MLTATVASKDPKTGEGLRACLEQTGLVKPVIGCAVSTEGEWRLGSAPSIPDVLLLDLSADIKPYFALAAQFRRVQPAGCIIACSHWSPSPDLLLSALRAGVNEFLLKPIDRDMLHNILSRVTQAREPSGAVTPRKLILIMGAKGGVGSSTVAVNLGVQLAALKRHVVLLDFASPVGHVPLLLDLKPRFSISDAMDNLERLDTHFLGGLLAHHASGLEVLAGSSQPGDRERIMVSSVMRMLNVAQSTFDFVLVDFGSVFSKQWEPVFESAGSVLVIAEVHAPALWNLQQLLASFAGFGLDRERVRIVINRWHRADEGVVRKLEEVFGVPVFARLPNDHKQVSEAITLGVPLSHKSKTPLLAEFQGLACKCAGLEPAARTRAAGVSAVLTRPLRATIESETGAGSPEDRPAGYIWRSVFPAKVS